MTPRTYPPQLRWLYVPDLAHLLVLADNCNPVEKTVRVLDLSLARQVRGTPVPLGRVPAAALLRPLSYPRTLLGEWTRQAWARWKIEKAERETREKKDGPASWRRPHTTRRKSRPNNRFLWHKRR